MYRIRLFWIFTTVFLLHQFVEKYLSIRISLLDNYLDPLLFMPILLSLVLWERRWWLKSNRNYVLPITHVWGYCLITIILAEILFPKLNPSFKADWIDSILYVIGSMIFIKFMNGQTRNTANNT